MPEDLNIPGLAPNELKPMDGLGPSQSQLMPSGSPIATPKPRDQRMDLIRNMLSNFMYSFGQGMMHNQRGNPNAAIGASLMAPYELEQFRLAQQRVSQQIELQKAQEVRLGEQSKIQSLREQRLAQQEEEMSQLVPVTSPDGKSTIQVQMRAMPAMVSAGWKIQSAEKIAAGQNVSRENVANIQATGADKRLQESFDMRKRLQEFAQGFQKEQLQKTLANRTENANIMANRPQVATVYGAEGPSINVIKPATAYATGGKSGVQQIATGSLTRPPDISSTDRQNIAGMWASRKALVNIYKTIDAAGPAIQAMGPLAGRVTEALAKMLGGTALSDEEQRLVAQKDVAILGRAFAEAGKQLTEGEKKVVMGSLAELKDRPGFAKIKIEEGLKFLNDKLRTTIGTLSKERIGQLKNEPVNAEMMQWYGAPFQPNVVIDNRRTR